MNISHITSLLEDILSAQSEPQLESILNENIAFKKDGTLHSNLEIAPKVDWAIKVRRYLALRKEELLEETINEAKGNHEIFIFLKAYTSTNTKEINRLTEKLVFALRQAERFEELVTIFLLCLDLLAQSVEIYSEFSLEQQKQRRESGILACRKAIIFAQFLKDKPCQAIYNLMLGGGFIKSHQLSKAELFCIEALQLYQELAAREPNTFAEFMATTFDYLGVCQNDMQKFPVAEESYTKSLQLYRELVTRKPNIFNEGLATVLNNLGLLQCDMQKLPEAEESLTEALRIRRKLARQKPHIFKQYVATTLNNLGILQSSMQKLTKAEKSYLEALSIRQDLAAQKPDMFNREIANTLNNLGILQNELQKLPAAEKSFTEALELFQILAMEEPHIFKQYVATVLWGLGSVHFEMQNLPVAEEFYLKALNIYEELETQEPYIFNQNLATIFNNLGYLMLKQDRFDEALNNFEEAEHLIEELLAKTFTIDDRSRIFRENVRLYNGLLICFIKLKDWKKALEIAERDKSRSINDLLNLEAENFQPKAPTLDEVSIIEVLGKKYSDSIKVLQQIESYERSLIEELTRNKDLIKQTKINKNYNSETGGGILEIHEQLKKLEQEKQKIQNRRFVKQAELQSILAEINNYDRNFPPRAQAIDAISILEQSRKTNQTIILFRLLKESTALFFVFPTGEIVVKIIEDFGVVEMLKLFREKWIFPYFRWKNKSITLGEWKEAIEQTLELLYEKLIVYVHQTLNEELDSRKQKSRKILFVPNQSLSVLPLHAASWKDGDGSIHYLLEEYTISYASSVSVFKRCRENEKQRSNTTLFVTNPKEDLDFSEDEVEYIKNIHLNSKSLKRENATKTAVIEALREDFSFIHFSCHGFYKHKNPFDSGLIMSDDVINLSEIINCNLQNNWLMTLSACETGLVNFSSLTDEHFGLPLGFILAGSPSVWASLWAVSDIATAELMKKAYRNLDTEEYKTNKPEALRQAQLSMLNDKDTIHPFFWASFQHFGI